MLAVVRGNLHQTPGVTILRTRAISLFAPTDQRIYTQIDGEYAGPLPVTLEIVPRSLTLLLPHQYRSRRRDSTFQQEWTTSHTR